MKILVCDDEEKFVSSLVRALEKIFINLNIEVSIVTFTDATKVIQYLESFRDIDIVFMDIMMGEINGYDVAKDISKLDSRIKIIFLSATAAYAIKGYDIKATRYLIKPLKVHRLQAVLQQVIEEIQRQENNYIIEKNDQGIHKIFIDEIIYIETADRHTIIHTVSENVLSYKSMKEHEKRLQYGRFIRCHSSY